MSRIVKDSTQTKEFVTTAREQNLGICATCNYAPTCVNLKGSKQPIWHCDQFDDFVPQSDAGSPVATREPVAKAEPVNGTQVELVGLCRNCANRENCVNLVAGRTVWHCEEYC
jgi:hypothetical protein